MTTPKSSSADTPAQHWDPDRYARNARFVADLGAPLLDLLAPQTGERILDLGCGDGALTAKLVDAGVNVVGVDASAEQIEAAKALGLDARVVDGHDLPFDGEFDGILSNAALHWMTRPDEVIAGMWRALKPGGRIAAEMGGAGNVGAVVRALSEGLADRGEDPKEANPWFFPSPEDYRTRLEKAGFEVSYIELIPRPTPLPGDISDWLETFGESFLKRVPVDERPAFVASVREELRPILFSAESGWVADYVRLRFAAAKPTESGT